MFAVTDLSHDLVKFNTGFSICLGRNASAPDNHYFLAEHCCYHRTRGRTHQETEK